MVTTKDLISPTISILALLFTIGTFWWNNWRRGSLQSDAPRIFAASHQGGILRVTLPLVLSNSGARTLVVTGLCVRLRLVDAQDRELPCIGTYDDIDPNTAKRSFVTNVVIPGRDSRVGHFEFRSADARLGAGANDVSLDVLLAHNNSWQTLSTFEIEISKEHIANLDRLYIVYPNAAGTPIE
jgi:hypothetical protein